MEKTKCWLCSFEAPIGDELDEHILKSHANIFRKDPKNSNKGLEFHPN
jgi:hypothetical protein